MSDPLTTLRLLYAGGAILHLLYGIYLILTIICLRYLLKRRPGRRFGGNPIVLAYTILTFLVTTVFLTAWTKFTEILLIGPASVDAGILLSRLDLLQRNVYNVKIWLADSLLIYRLWVVWGGDFRVVIVPVILLSSAIGLGISGVALFDQMATKALLITHLGVSFHACSVALNVIATSLIAGKLLHHRRVVQHLGESHSKEYLSLLAVFAESGAIYSISGIVYIPLYALNSNGIYIMAPVLEEAAGIGPSLILIRIALGVAVERNVNSQRMSTLQFGGGAGSESKGAPDSEGTMPNTISFLDGPHTRDVELAHHSSGNNSSQSFSMSHASNSRAIEKETS